MVLIHETIIFTAVLVSSACKKVWTYQNKKQNILKNGQEWGIASRICAICL